MRSSIGAHPRATFCGVVQLVENYKGDVAFSQTLLSINSKPPQAEIDATRPVMRTIEANLIHQCGLTKLGTGVRESCTGVECEPLD